MKLHDKIRWARKQRGWSLGCMVKQTRMSFDRLSEIEAGKPVKLSELVKIADALKLDIFLFFLKDDDPKVEIYLWCKENR